MCPHIYGKCDVMPKVRIINMKSQNLTLAERYLGICTAPRISATKMKPQSLTSTVRFLDND